MADAGEARHAASGFQPGLDQRVMGALAGVLRNSWLDRFVMAFTAVSVSMPAFWIGLMLVMRFAV